MLTHFFPNTPTLSFQTNRTNSLESLQKKAEFDQVDWVTLTQMHSNICHIIDTKPDSELEGDALVTTTQNLVLLIKTADCLPILFYHPYGIIGAVHAGRVGTQNKIIQKTLQKMKNTYQIDLSQIQFWFGPAICKSCYQIDQVKNTHFGLYKENYSQIKKFLQSEPHISYSNICTLEHPNFHSYRQNGKNAGRNWSGILIPKKK